MTRSRLRRILLGFVVATLACLGTPGWTAKRADWVRGTVSDPRGHRLAQVTVEVSRLPTHASVLTATTNERGEFLLSGLVPGLYLLTARKQGYSSATSKLNTLIDRSVRLVMPPLLGEMLPEAPPVVPETSGWALRLPRRDLLRDLGAEEVLAGGAASTRASDAPVPSGGEPGVRLEGNFEQRFALVSDAAEAEGSTTQVDLGANLGSNVRFSLSGLSGDASLDADPEDGILHREHQQQAARLGGQFRPRSSDQQVEFSALASERSYGVTTAIASQGDGYDQKLEGYGARWKRAIGSRGSMDVELDYRSVEVATAAGENSDPTHSGQPIFNDADNQLWEAVGSMQLDVGARRRMSVDLRARRLNVTTPGSLALPTFAASGGVPGDGRERWAFDLHGREERSLGGPVSLDYGFHYHRRMQRVFSEASTDAFIPQAGISFAQEDGTRWSAGVSLALDAPEALFTDTGSTSPELDDDTLLARMGYRLGVEHPFERQRLMLAVNAAYHPFAYAPLDRKTAEHSLSAPRHRPFLVSEGNADSLQLGVELQKRFRGFVAAVESQLGQVEGYMAAGYFDEMPVRNVSYNLVRYMVTSARGYRPGSGTLVHLDYQRYLNNPNEDLELSGLSYQFERINLALEQDLPFIALWDAHWRFLIAYQTLRTDAQDVADAELLRGAGVLASESRLSGGLAIRF